MESRYQFTNWTDEPFEGRFGGVPYLFAPQETKDFDPDKHYMLIILSKQLADKELAKGVKGVLRSKEAGNDYGKAIDEHGNLYKITPEMRKELMIRAIGELANKPVPYPEVQEDEAGQTKQTSENIATLQEQVRALTELVQGLAGKLGEVKSEPPAAPPPAPISEIPPVGNGQPQTEAVAQPSSTGLTRDALVELATEKGIVVTQEMTKEQLVQAVAV